MNLLTEHLATWIAADTSEKSARGRSAAASLYGVKKLRELILELAVRGLLVPQNADDEPASELLKKIAAEKAKLVKEGKIKAQKPLPPIGDDEKPFELPKGWEWVRLPDIYYSIPVGGNQLLSSEIKETGDFPVVDQGQRFIAGYTNREELLIKIPSAVIVFGDHTKEFKLIDFDFVAGADGVKILRPVIVNERFFWLQLSNLKLESRGYARHFKVLNESFFSIPPLAEQQRIVTKVDELMALCDQLEQQQNNSQAAHQHLVSQLLNALTQAANANDFQHTWQRIASHFDVLFTTEDSINQLKQSILQLAVMGKLVPQNPDDEPASELLKKIAAEKAKLVKEGKIKAQKPLAVIGDDEKPFELPKGWEWVRIENCCDVQGGIQKTPIRLPKNNHFPYLRVANVQRGWITVDVLERYELFNNELEQWRLQAGDLLIVEGNGSESEIGRCAIWQGQVEDCVFQNHLMRVRPRILKFVEFLQLFLNSPIGSAEMRRLAITTSGLFNLSVGKIRNIVVALPPTKEQQRIVTKVDELMALCDQLKNQLNQAKHLQGKIADVLVEQALA
ncbi:restriction endonuclease subunit S [Moraxellaceae bacterium AER2_44_116]|nr:restriction endonuclease subunit S [Moraxellaceae bacterium]TQC97023.1 restriction endonuclease subunit S [Moraxellaceae bacterium AER2_44_116]